MDLQLGSVVDCLGLHVRVVERAVVPGWQETQCPGFLTSTTELERSETTTTQVGVYLAPSQSYYHVLELAIYEGFLSLPTLI